MSGLLEQQVNAQRDKTSGVHASSCKPTKKVCNENERNKQEKSTCIKMLLILWKEALYNAHTKNW